jgi:undecaprenyl-diphosphatase
MAWISSIKELDTQLFLWLNSRHNEFFDPIMYWASHRLTWIPLYLLLFFLVLKYFGKRAWLPIIAVALVAVCCDQLSVHAFKNVFLRYRPCHNLLIMSQVHLNDGCGGTYGFISSHAANTFGLATFIFMLLRNQLGRLIWLMPLWAAFVSYSRIYNGVHYPADVVCGALLGIAVALVISSAYQLSFKKIFPAAAESNTL